MWPHQVHELLPILEKAKPKLRAADSAVADVVAAAVREIQTGALSKQTLQKLWLIFAPTCDWDDLVGDVSLGHEVFEILSELRDPPGVRR